MVGYKWYDEARTRRSAEILKMLPGEKLDQFKKRCKKLGYEACDKRAVVDHYKNLSEELIKADLDTKRHPNLFLMTCNLVADLNVASCIRAANAFGVKHVYIYGEKRYNRKGTINSHNHLNLSYLTHLQDFNEIRNKFEKIICIENCAGAVPINSHKWNYDQSTLIIVGNEGYGCPGEFLDVADAILEIKMIGSCRSINVSQACSVALYDYNVKIDS